MSIAPFLALVAISVFVKKPAAILALLTGLIFVLLGFIRAQSHSLAYDTPFFPRKAQYTIVTGWVENIDTSAGMKTIRIRVKDISKEGQSIPKRVRVRLKAPELRPGQKLKIAAMLKAPPRPALPGGYDTARASYFSGIGGFGFAVSKWEPTEFTINSPIERLKRAIVRARYDVSARIKTHAPAKTAGLQAALLTGDRSSIPKAQEQALRDAGLAHMLAISGLHMGLLAGSVYFLMGWGLSFITPLSERVDIRKFAAVFGALVASFYLIISGMGVATQRAYIMACVAFLAIILDRRALSLRSVALAMFITLVLHPESALSAGFQMSFAATAALVVVYRYWAERRVFTPSRTIYSRLENGFSGLFLTSVVAGGATGGFAAIHFHRFARYGLIGNLLAMPVFTLVVMPAGFLGVFLMPVGLDQYPFWIMGKGLEFILWIANWVSGLKGAVWQIKHAGPWVQFLFVSGFVCLILLGRIGRTLALVCIGMSVGIWMGARPPDMRVSEAGQIAFWQGRREQMLWIDDSRADRFGRKRFAEQAGVPKAPLQRYRDTSVPCDEAMCRVEIKGKVISILSTPEGVSEACANSDFVILTNRVAGPVAARHCLVPLIDAKGLSRHGSVNLWVRRNTIKLKYANPPSRQARPWGE